LKRVDRDRREACGFGEALPRWNGMNSYGRGRDLCAILWWTGGVTISPVREGVMVRSFGGRAGLGGPGDGGS